MRSTSRASRAWTCSIDSSANRMMRLQGPAYDVADTNWGRPLRDWVTAETWFAGSRRKYQAKTGYPKAGEAIPAARRSEPELRRPLRRRRTVGSPTPRADARVGIGNLPSLDSSSARAQSSSSGSYALSRMPVARGENEVRLPGINEPMGEPSPDACTVTTGWLVVWRTPGVDE